MSELAKSQSAQLPAVASGMNTDLPLFGGFGLHLLYGQVGVRCLFDSRLSASSFLRFSEIYVNEAQAGNSYGGFFPPCFTGGQAGTV